MQKTEIVTKLSVRIPKNGNFAHSPNRKLTGQKSFCRSCGEYFNSVAAFDKHRTGKHGPARTCRTRAEMRATGMVINNRGWWITAPRIDHP